MGADIFGAGPPPPGGTSGLPGALVKALADTLGALTTGLVANCFKLCSGLRIGDTLICGALAFGKETGLALGRLEGLAISFFQVGFGFLIFVGSMEGCGHRLFLRVPCFNHFPDILRDYFPA